MPRVYEDTSNSEAIRLRKKIFDGTEYWYLDCGHGDVKRIWLSHKLLQKDERGAFLEFPLAGVRLVTTEKGTKIMKPGPYNCFWVSMECGYRGSSRVEVLSPVIDVVEFWKYDSPRGSLGTNHHALVVTEADYVKFSWSRTGRTYGGPREGVTIIRLDGTMEELDRVQDEEIAEIMREIEEGREP
jgi:hypothetical protein